LRAQNDTARLGKFNLLLLQERDAEKMRLPHHPDHIQDEVGQQRRGDDEQHHRNPEPVAVNVR